jgi:hypothetical protein
LYLEELFMIYTTYFSSKKYKQEDGVSIARWAPFWNGLTFKALAPNEALLKWWKNLAPEDQGKADFKDYYEKRYRLQTLSSLDPKEVAMILECKVLLCFEKTGDFCHRHIVAKWLREAGFECEEIL